MSKTYTVPPAPPHNEGKTIAAWALTVGVVLGAVVAAFGIALLNFVYVWVGAAIIVVTMIVSIVLKFAGLGKKRHDSTRTEQAAAR